jgi:hypothetical protein
MGWRSYYGRFNRADPMMRAFIVAGLILLGVIVLPRVPGVGAGVDCMNLPQPMLSGNNQSVLASRVDPADLTLELLPDRTVLAAGEALVMTVRINNASIAPLTLFLVPQEFVFRYTGQEAGLVFAVQSLAGQVLGEPFSVRAPFPARQQFTPQELRVLGPRSRCTLRVTIDSARLTSSGVSRGEYRITAVYRNQARGALPAVGALTPTPIFRDQGAWVGEVRSNEVIISVGVAPPGQ